MIFDDLPPGASVFLDASTILSSRIHYPTISPAWIATAAGLSRQTGLLSNDALIVAAVQNYGLVHLASNAADLDRAPGLLRFAPA